MKKIALIEEAKGSLFYTDILSSLPDAVFIERRVKAIEQSIKDEQQYFVIQGETMKPIYLLKRVSFSLEDIDGVNKMKKEYQAVNKLAAKSQSISEVVAMKEIEDKDTNRKYLEVLFGYGEDLLTLIKKGIPDETIVKVLAQTAEAIELAHKEGLFHLNLCLQNIYFKHGRAKIVDFGPKVDLTTVISKSVYKANKCHYPPEVAEPGRKIASIDKGKVEAYMWGIVCYQMVLKKTEEALLKECEEIKDKKLTAEKFMSNMKDAGLYLVNATFMKRFIALLGECLTQNPHDRPSFEKIATHWIPSLLDAVEEDNGGAIPFKATSKDPDKDKAGLDRFEKLEQNIHFEDANRIFEKMRPEKGLADGVKSGFATQHLEFEDNGKKSIYTDKSAFVASTKSGVAKEAGRTVKSESSATAFAAASKMEMANAKGSAIKSEANVAATTSSSKTEDVTADGLRRTTLRSSYHYTSLARIAFSLGDDKELPNEEEIKAALSQNLQVPNFSHDEVSKKASPAGLGKGSRGDVPRTDYLGAALKNLPHYIIVDLHRSIMDKKDVLLLAEKLKTSLNLKILNLSCAGIGEIGGKAIGMAFTAEHNIEELRLGNNKIGGKGAIGIANLIKVSKTLKRLLIYWNDITDVCVPALIDALKANKGLKELILFSGSKFSIKSKNALQREMGKKNIKSDYRDRIWTSLPPTRPNKDEKIYYFKKKAAQYPTLRIISTFYIFSRT